MVRQRKLNSVQKEKARRGTLKEDKAGLASRLEEESTTRRGKMRASPSLLTVGLSVAFILFFVLNPQGQVIFQSVKNAYLATFAGREVTIHVYPNGALLEGAEKVDFLSLTVNTKDGVQVIAQLKQEAAKHFKFGSDSEKINIWFQDGSRVRQVFDLHDTDRANPLDKDGILVFAGAQGTAFMFSAVRVGYELAVKTNANTYTLTTLSVKPRVFQINGLLDSAECDQLAAKVEGSMEKSWLNEDGHEKKYKEVRTSSTAWLGSGFGVKPRGYTGSLVHRVQQRVAAVTKTSIKRQEGVQVIYYEKDQHYWNHVDFYHPTTYKSNREFEGGWNRYATVLLYLSNVTEGGETNFPKAGDNAVESISRDHHNCDRGISVPPLKGAAVLFYNLEADTQLEGTVDWSTWHSGCDVITGNKWAANVWIWNKNKDHQRGRK